jgi:hypothetical protein
MSVREPFSMQHNTSESLMLERRITLRLLGYWEKLRGTRPMPREEDIDPEDIHDLWDNCMLVHVKDLDKPDYNYTYMGQGIVEAYQFGMPASEVGSGSLSALNANFLMRRCKQIIETRKPLLDEGEFRNMHNELVKYRQCLLPLGEGDKVVAIFGGMRFKIF